MKRTIGFVAGVVVLLAVTTGCSKSAPKASGAAAPVKAVELKLNVTTVETSSWTEGARRFAALIKERTGGRYTVAIYPNEQLAAGDQTGTLAMFYQDSGIIDIDIHSAMLHNNQIPELTVCFMPWIFSKGNASVDEILFAPNAPGGKVIMDYIAKKGPVPLALGENGFRQITNNRRPIAKVEDFRNLKMRVPAVPILTDLFKLLGSDPTAMSFSEVFTALQQNTIDGQENPLGIIQSSKLNEVQKYLTVCNYCYDPIVLAVSNKRWASLSDDDKKIFQQSATDAMKYQVEYNRDVDAKVLDALKAGGMQVNEMTPAEIAAFQSALAPLYKTYMDRLGPELFAAFGYKAN
ncbi:MAG: DctP family TRAP transporter solute-binding subunit [Spirochaetaceae bacterium]|jgi:tripartite ATP-independent transporter DctP family solute receptor|nr:DctP family TRAP transporter solute-binding subunit [Spirochaetaceae bacterium]